MNHSPLTRFFNWIFYLNKKENLFYYEKKELDRINGTSFYFDISSERIE